MVKSVLVLVAWIVLLVWTFEATDGGGDLFTQKSSIRGSAYKWAFLSSLTSLIGNFGISYGYRGVTINCRRT